MNYPPAPSPMDSAHPKGLPEHTVKMPEEFFERFSPPGKRYALSMVHDHCDAEEIVQDAFCKMIKAFENNGLAMKTEGHIRATFFTTVRNLCFDHLRRKERERKFRNDQEIRSKNPVSNGTDDSDSAVKQINFRVARTLETMPPEWADALKLKMNGELTYNQIAQVMEADHGKVSHGQVRTWIYRARREIESSLKKNGLM